MSVCINKRDQYWHDTTPDIFVQYYRVTEKKKTKKVFINLEETRNRAQK